MCLCPYLERTQTTQTRATPAATSRSRLTAGCCRSRFMVANCIFESPSNAQSRLRQQLAVRRERRTRAMLESEAHTCSGCATRCCAEGASVLSVFFSKSIRGTVTNQKHMSRRLTVSPQISRASHSKRPRFAQIHTDTPLFSPTSEKSRKTNQNLQTNPYTNPESKNSTQTPKKKTLNNTQHTLCRNNPKITPEQKKTDRTAEISRRKNTYVNKIRICEAGRRICAYAPNFSPFRK